MFTYYFAGSIRGGSQDSALYKTLITHIQENHGSVLTEHVGDFTRNAQKEMNENEIWRKDMAWLHEADIVIAECTVTSLGVGYELGIAEKSKKPTLCLYRIDEVIGTEMKKLSAMISGNPFFKVIYYKSTDEAKSAIDSFINGIESKN